MLLSLLKSKQHWLIFLPFFAFSCSVPQKHTVRIVDGRRVRGRYVSPGAYEHYIRAQLLRTHGDLKNAAKQLTLALAFDPNSPWLHSQIAAIYDELHRDADAKKHLVRALSISPNLPETLVIWGDIEQRHNRPETALLRYKHCKPEDPTALFCHLRAVQLLFERGDKDDARLALARILNNLKSETQRLQFARFSAARLALHAAGITLSTILPNCRDISTLHFAARVAQAQGQTVHAIALLNRAIALGSPTLFLLRDRVTFLSTAPDTPNFQDFVDTLNTQQIDEASRVKLIDHLLTLNVTASAFSLLPAKFSTERDFSTALAKARVLCHNNQRSDGLKIARSIAATVQRTKPTRALATTFIQCGKSATAWTHITRKLRNNPSDVELLLAGANVLVAQNKLAQAESFLKKTNVHHTALIMQRAIILARMGRWDKVSYLAHEVLKREPSHAEAYNLIGFARVKRGDIGAYTEKTLYRALELAPLQPHIMDSLGTLFLARGQLARANEIFTAALRLAPYDQEIHKHVDETIKRMKKAAESTTR